MKKLGFGTMRLPLLNSEDPKSIDYKQFDEMVDHFLENGFTYFDTAYPYHGEVSEAAVKRCLVDRYSRESFVLADKMPIMRVKAAEDYQRFFDEQLKRCGVDYFDYYLLHNIGRDRYENTVKYGGFEFISKMKEKGYVGKIGFSFHDNAELLDRVLTEHPEVDFVQLQINYLDWDSPVAQSGACYETAAKHNKPVIVMEPVKGGTLANLPPAAMEEYRRSCGKCENSGEYENGKEYEKCEEDDKNGKYGGQIPSPASYAIRYAASLDNVMMVLSGMSSMEQLVDNVSYMKDFVPLNEQERQMLARITDILNSTVSIPCTNCKYCMEECPKNINIPAYFGLYNLHSVTGKKTNMYYERYKLNHGLASECIECGRCEKICPQHINIRKNLKEFVDLYEKE